MTHVSFEPAALDELDAAYIYYESLVAGLGERLKQQVQSKIDVIEAHPEAYALWMEGVRRTTLGAFPYTLYYRPGTDEVRVVAFLFASSDPDEAARQIGR